MQVKVIRDFKAVKPGDVYPSDIRAGDIVDGRLAEIAVEKKCCVLSGDETTTPLKQQSQSTAENPSKVVGAEGAGDSTATGADKSDKSENSQPIKPTVVRARLKERYEGPDDKGKTIKIAKGSIVSAPLAQTLVDIGVATIVETRAVDGAPETR